MSISALIGPLPRTTVRLWLGAARAPLTAYELVVRRGNPDPAWAPAIAFDRFEATVMVLAGALLGDDRLVESGRLTRTKVARVTEAAGLDAVAEEKRAGAEEELNRRQDRNAERRREVKRKAELRKSHLEQEAKGREAQIEQETEQKRARARNTEQAVENSLKRTARQARGAQVKRRLQAVDAEREAIRAHEDVTQIDAAIDEVKQARRSGG